MAVVSHPALSPEWSFPSPINPFDAPSFTSHIEFADHQHGTATVGAVQQSQASNKRRAYEIEWDDSDERDEVRAKKLKTAAAAAAVSAPTAPGPHAVDPQQLHGDHPPPPLPQIEQVLSILVDALNSTTTTSPHPPPAPPLAPTPTPDPIFTVSISSNAPAKHPASILRCIPTSPLSECPNRAPFVRKVIGGSCAGRTEANLCRWVLCRSHFLGVRCRDPTAQSSEWVQTLHEMGWEELHPYYQAQAAEEEAAAFDALNPFSRWIEDDFDYDGTEDAEGDWSDEEDEEGEIHDDDNGSAQRGVWDSGIVLQLPDRPSA